MLTKYIPFSVYRIICNGTERKWRTVNAWNYGGHQTDSSEGRSYEVLSEAGQMHSYHDEEASEGHSSISRRLPEEGDVHIQKTTYR